MPTTSTALSSILSKFPDVKKSGKGWKARCPAHEDGQASLSIGEGDDGAVLLHCFAGCETSAVLAAMGMSMADLMPPKVHTNGHQPAAKGAGKETRYELLDAAGTVVAVHVRLDTSNGKRMWWELPGGKKGLGGRTVESLPLFGTEILPALQDGAIVVVTEGEKAAAALLGVGIPAAGTVTGANTIPDAVALEALTRFSVVLWPDNDDIGRVHMGRIAARLAGIGVAARIADWPEAPLKGDAADAVPMGVDVGPLLGAAQPWRSPAQAELSAILADVRDFIRKFMVMNEAQLTAVTLWAAHTHVFQAGDTTPYLSIRSPEKRSGKSRLLEVVELVVPTPLKGDSISVAALAHSVDRGCTLLLDEVDTIFGKGKEVSEVQQALRGILDSGFRRGGAYIRMSGQGAAMTPNRFSTYGPKALSGIGTLPGTLEDRSIAIELRRRAKDEPVQRFRHRDAAEQGKAIVNRLSAWGAAAIEALQTARPPLPDELDDRAQDAWEILLGIADLAGGDWPTKARAAAVELSTGWSREDESIGVRLLVDIKAVMDARAAERMFTKTLVKALNEIEESPWGGIGKDGIDGRGLAKLLSKPYGIKAEQVRVGAETSKGYKREAFRDAWSRYLPPGKWETGKQGKHTPVENVSFADNVSPN